MPVVEGKISGMLKAEWSAGIKNKIIQILQLLPASDAKKSAKNLQIIIGHSYLPNYLLNLRHFLYLCFNF